MSYYIHTDQVEHISKVHVEVACGGCGAYERRKEERLPDNWWCGPYATALDAAFAGWAGKIDTVTLCKKCKHRWIMGKRA